ncbi:24994_t:CDS:2, partial [Gigaspora margarita]
CPYEDIQGAATQLALAYDEVNCAKARKRRVNTLVYAFYFSVWLSTTTGFERTAAKEKPLGVEQIYRTKHTRTCKVAKLSKKVYERLVQPELVAQTFFGEGEL